MLDPFVLLAPILLLIVVALLGFVGCVADPPAVAPRPPAAPGRLFAQVENSVVFLSWDGSPDADSYKVRRSHKDGGEFGLGVADGYDLLPPPSAPAPPSHTTYRDTPDWNAHNAYYYVVQAVNSVGDGDLSNQEVAKLNP